MTTYTSTNSRSCADCGLRRCPKGCNSLGLLTSVLPADAILSGEIRPGLSYTLTTVDLDAKQTYVYMEDGSLATVPVVDVPQHPADYVTMTGVLEAFGNQPQSHADARSAGPWVPVWSLLLIFLGMVLMAACWVFNDQTSRFVWSLITGEPM